MTGAKRVVLSALGSRGDVHPMLALAKTLQTAGCEPVVLLAEPYQHLATAMGIESRAVIPAADFETLLHRPEIWHPTRGVRVLLAEVLMGYLPKLWGLIEELVDPLNGIVVSHPLDLASRMYREQHAAVTHIGIQLAPVAIRSWADPPRLGPHWIGVRRPSFLFHSNCWLADQIFVRRWVGKGLNRFRESLALPPVSRPLHRWCHSPDGNLCLFPSWFGPSDLPANFLCVGFPLFDGPESHSQKSTDEQTPATVQPKPETTFETQPVVFTAGSAHKSASNFFADAVEACERLGVPGILLSSSYEQIPNRLPNFVEHRRYAPLGDLLHQASLIVHHGGIGTTSQAMASATPQIICPMAYDQFDNAMRVRRLGCGVELTMKHVSAPTLTRRIQSVLHSHHGETMRQRCDEVAEQVAQQSGEPALHAASDWILRQAREKSS